MRRIVYVDAETGKRFVFLTNNFTLPALTIAQLYNARWRIELFFKWIKQQSAHQNILWYLRERSEDPDLDCHLGLRARCHRQETTESRPKPLHNSTDSEHHALRENAHFAGAFRTNLHKPKGHL